ncbi:hypothetical protein BDQ12DRAFT_733207 [Crucibulum laeve]|uniref:R3H domain-containing protein n=1 Tax=Crucibulum laeve TaxID=68775 RepID=A0A5C3MBC3_9AGAR|nr:hypothetical protein BDQ12DRAFT_733207 [Crucibulum laeve]
MDATVSPFIPQDENPDRNRPNNARNTSPTPHLERPPRTVNRNGPRRQNRPPRTEGERSSRSEALNGQPDTNNVIQRPKKPRNRPPRVPTTNTNTNDPTTSASTSSTPIPEGEGKRLRNGRRRNPPTATSNDIATASTTERKGKGEATGQRKAPGGGRRGARFNASLTQTDTEATTSKPSEKYRAKSRAQEPIGDDLTSTLAHALSTPPYPDCPICFSSIHPAQPTWSCSPSTPVILADGEEAQYCWTTFHVKCIRSWASKSVKEIAEAWRARGEDKTGDWRCPGCQSKREVVPSGYWCFCNSTAEPKPSRLSTPHSCGGPCSRVRESGCGHPCALSCHPGPCPPCQITTRLECYCPGKKVIAFRCGLEQKGGSKAKRNLSCGEVCGRPLGCGKHTCDKVCHEGECGKCQVREMARCYCGKEEKEVGCGEGSAVQCYVEQHDPWIGRFSGDHSCGWPFECSKHKCEKPCHPPSQTPVICPFDPSKVSHCPCGQSTVAPLSTSDFSQYTFPAREKCTDPIPTCSSICSKLHPSCSHPCRAKCHTGPCPPCSVGIVRPCRCGASTRSILCCEIHQGESAEEKEILCDRQCTALRACRRHQCRRVCCPLASLAATGKKGRKRIVEEGPAVGEERGGLHECDLVCGKLLSCGNHRCEERDHKGVCPPCLRSSFEEMVCFCGRTVFEPPIPCGTRIQCHYPCPRPPPPCGHPRTPHSCHEDPTPCPACPCLTTKECACGKKMVPNVRCSLEREKVSCGTVCGKLMGCGFHHCERLCHGDDCGPCTTPCGKSRKLCLPNNHPCTQPCHAPSTCPETESCQSIVILTCPCGRIRQSVHCGRSASHPSGSLQASPKCSNDCNIAKRNARLAEALGISGDTRDKNSPATYHDEVVAFARANSKFLPVVEKAFSDFISSDRRTQVLPHMTPDRRKFVHDLAAVYRMDTQMVDQEPHRSVQLLRRVDTRIPSLLLSTYIASSGPPPSLGKLADLRSLKNSATSASSWRPVSAITPKPSASGVMAPVASGSQRGWTPVARPSSAGLASTSSHSTRTPTPTNTARSSAPRAPVPDVVQPPATTGETDEAVPENWEDDV